MSMPQSTIVEDRIQIDGRRHVLERHTDRNGKHYDFRYLAEAGADVNSIMATRAEALYNQLIKTSEEKEHENGIWTE